ncbi:DUF3817 domain-containing protein [Nocardiopsis sp. CNT312]|uniref:DUF3817 domain-containing protein n=1 Tax=Nocardiopsis sp. CNT312 TaxID=1137268 RepID=UPI0004BC732C|nr:DUF3817 domain-containing protein [Nocardiopsis sp. CNT312]
MRTGPRWTATAFRAVAVLEAFTWAGLLIGVAFKYPVNGEETGVHVCGPLHGAAFMAYVPLTLAAALPLRWGARPTLVALSTSVPPLCTLAADRWLHRTGLLAPGQPEREPRPVSSRIRAREIRARNAPILSSARTR